MEILSFWWILYYRAPTQYMSYSAEITIHLYLSNILLNTFFLFRTEANK